MEVARGKGEGSSGDPEGALARKDQAHRGPTRAPSLHLHQELNEPASGLFVLLCLPSVSCKAQEMIDNPGWGCLGRMFWFVTLILAAPVNDLLEARVGEGLGGPLSALHLELFPEPVGTQAVKTQPQTPGRHSSDLIFS